MKLNPLFDDVSFSCMQTQSSVIISKTKRNPFLEEIEIGFVKSKPYSAWQVRIKRENESADSTYFRTEEEAHKFIEYIESII